MSGYRVERLGKHHDRKAFRCGSESLDRYFRERATQDEQRRLALCFVAVAEQDDAVAGFYTLAATSIALDIVIPPSEEPIENSPASSSPSTAARISSCTSVCFASSSVVIE